MARRGPAAETARLYAADWKAFVAWCQEAGLAALPAMPATVAAFLAGAGEEGEYGAGALGRRAAAIAARHRQAGLPAPTTDPAVRAILRAARRSATPRRRPPPRPAQLLRMAAACPGNLAGVRDRALLLLAAAGFFPRAAARWPGPASSPGTSTSIASRKTASTCWLRHRRHTSAC